jgi:purine-cytosine permease-like protein
MGLSRLWSIVAGVTGIAFGTLFMAFHATQGPVLGLPQLIQSRAQFGYRGVLLPLLGTLFTFGGFIVVDTVIIKAGLNSIFGWSTLVVAIVINVASAAVAIFGHDLLHKTFRILFWISLPLWAVLTAGVLFGGVHGESCPHSFTLVAFVVQSVWRRPTTSPTHRMSPTTAAICRETPNHRPSSRRCSPGLSPHRHG